MVSNQFFVKQGPFPLKEIVKAINSNNNLLEKENIKIHGVESLLTAKKTDITF